MNAHEIGGPIRVLRIISRLVIGGPTFHVAILKKGLDRSRFLQCLAAGQELPGERSMVPELVSQRIIPTIVPELVGESSIGRCDARAFAAIVRLIHDFQPHIVHTHTGKAGILGRLAARSAGVPLVVHTFHGHVLHGYWGPLKTGVARVIERRLARMTDRLVAVSGAVKRDLVEYGVAPAEKIDVIPLGLDLDGFLATTPGTGVLRRELRAPAATPLVGIVGRVVPIKNHRLFLDAARHVLGRERSARFVVVGDGPVRAEAEAHAKSLGIESQVSFVGWRRDLESIYPDLDVVVVSSDNEGTPVSAIEAMASRRPVVSTRVGGVPDFIDDGATGVLVPPRSPAALGDAITRLLGDPVGAERIGTAARAAVRERFAPARLVADIDALYLDLIRRSPSAFANRAAPPIRIGAKAAPELARVLSNF